MTREKKLYRSRNTLLGGVSTGVAEYFNFDPIVVQILTVVLTLASAGLLAIAYIALWIVIPPAPSVNEPLEVEPDEVHSDTYGPVAGGRQENIQAVAAHRAKNGPYTTYTASRGCAHVPPAPPAGLSQAASSPSAGNTFTEEKHMPPFYTTEARADFPIQASGLENEALNKPPRAALWIGFALLFIGISALLGTFVRGISWWQLWPLALVVIGIIYMTVPGEKGKRMNRFVAGLILLALGITTILFSTNIVSIASVVPIFVNLWPLLVIIGGFFVLGSAMKAPLFVLLGGLMFVVFCVVALGWFSLPGSTDMISFFFPTGHEHTYVIRPPFIG